MAHKNQTLRLAFSFLLLVLCSPVAHAQFNAGIQGTVTDSNGGAVSGAKITATAQETNVSREAVTNADGFYRVDALAPGLYTLTVEAPGFKKSETKDVAVYAEQIRGVDAKLEVGEVAQTVTVNGAMAPVLQTEDANISGTLTTLQVQDLPSFGRDPYELLRLAPGIFGDDARSSNGNAQNLPLQKGPGGSNSQIFQIENQVQIVSDGQRVSANNYQIDGVSANSLGWGGAAIITPNEESVKEIQVISSTYSAEDGRNSGAQVKVVSKNGANDYHGSGLVKFDDKGLNAFNGYVGPFGAPNVPPGSGFGRVDNKYRQFGGSVGGPIKHNSLFFFFSYEGERANNTTFDSNKLIETPDFRSYIETTSPNSLAAKVFATPGFAPRIAQVLTGMGGPVFCCSLDPAIPLGGYYDNEPAGLGPRSTPDFEHANLINPNTSSGNEFNGRLDYTRGKNQFFGSAYFTHVNDVQGGDRPIDDLTLVPFNWLLTFGWNRTFSTTLLNDFRFNVTRWSFNQVTSSSNTNFGIPFYNVFDFGIPGFGCCLNAGATQGGNTPGIFAQTTVDFRDTVTKLFGNHSIKFGVDIDKNFNNNNEEGGARPLFQFSSFLDFANDAPQFESITVDPRTGSLPNGKRNFRTSIYALFVQDDWKLRPNLMLNLGLRWEYFSPLTETNNLISNYVMGPNGETDGRVVAGKRLYNSDYHNFGPRLGFAWSPTRFNNKVVVRGGFGINYNRIYDNILDPVRFNTPFAAQYGQCCAGPGTSAASVGIDYVLGTSKSPFSYPANPFLAFGVDPVTGGLCANTGCTSDRQVTIWGSKPNLPNAYVYTYSLGAQWEFIRDTTLQLGYAGSSSHHLIRAVDLNRLNPGDTFDDVFDFTQNSGSNGLPCGPTNPTCTAPHLTGNPNFSNVFFPLADVNANYNALLLRMTHRFSHGFLLTGSYTFSKSLDFSSYEIGPQQDYPANQKLDYGPSDYDARHYVVIAGVWNLPIFRSRHDMVGKTLGGWNVSGVFTYHTGFPWTPVSFGPQNNNPVGDSYRPDRPTSYAGTCNNSPSNIDFINGVCPTTNTRTGTAPNDPNFPTLLTNCSAGTDNCFTTAFPRGGPPIGRNSFPGPHFHQFDFSFAKDFGVPKLENGALQFRANLFNALNTLNLAPIPNFSSNDDLSNPNAFGRSPGGLAGRVIEFQLRFMF
jgi:outer membrane receptor protein involved in Fe transport